jgi:hypothetical protein
MRLSNPRSVQIDEHENELHKKNECHRDTIACYASTEKKIPKRKEGTISGDPNAIAFPD